MTRSQQLYLMPAVSVLLGIAVGAGVLFWHFSLQLVAGDIKRAQSSIKKLTLPGNIPPNDKVVEYLIEREAVIKSQYQYWQKKVAAELPADPDSADLSVYFQQFFHEVQRTLEKQASARDMVVPAQLGFPKELPPVDAVPRLLVQLSLIKEMAALIFENQVSVLTSLKIEDPQNVADEDENIFLTRLPIRIRMTCTLEKLTKILAAIERQTPLIDVRGVRIVNQGSDELIDVELTLARYLIHEDSEDEIDEAIEKTVIGLLRNHDRDNKMTLGLL